MGRTYTTKNLYARKPQKVVEICDPVLRQAIGPAERKGCWLIYGKEKHGKTWLAMLLARDLSKGEKVAYVSAEEGLDKSFTDACRRAGITTDDKILWDEYSGIDALIARYSKPKAPRIIIIDNLTVYQDELKPSDVKKRLIDGLPSRLLILLGHEERNLPFPATTRMAGKWAKVIFHVKGLRAEVISRFAPGGSIVIDEAKSALFWGDNTTPINSKQ